MNSPNTVINPSWSGTTTDILSAIREAKARLLRETGYPAKDEPLTLYLTARQAKEMVKSGVLNLHEPANRELFLCFPSVADCQEWEEFLRQHLAGSPEKAAEWKRSEDRFILSMYEAMQQPEADTPIVRENSQ